MLEPETLAHEHSFCDPLKPPNIHSYHVMSVVIVFSSHKFTYITYMPSSVYKTQTIIRASYRYVSHAHVYLPNWARNPYLTITAKLFTLPTTHNLDF